MSYGRRGAPVRSYGLGVMGRRGAPKEQGERKKEAGGQLKALAGALLRLFAAKSDVMHYASRILTLASLRR